jgi:hypothetical protein
MKQNAKVVILTNTLAYLTGVLLRKKISMRWICEKMKRSRKQKLVSDQHSSLFD